MRVFDAKNSVEEDMRAGVYIEELYMGSRVVALRARSCFWLWLDVVRSSGTHIVLVGLLSESITSVSIRT